MEQNKRNSLLIAAFIILIAAIYIIFNKFISNLWIELIVFLIIALFFYLFWRKMEIKTIKGRAKYLESQGIISGVIYAGHILGLICIGLGIWAYIYLNQHQPGIGMIILGIIVILVLLFATRLRNKK